MINKYIAIEGNIGAGKTTLAELLAEERGAALFMEEFEKNSFLPDFYDDPERYSFPLELSFLADRYSQTIKTDFHQPVVADYHISKSFVFAGQNLGAEEYELFEKMYTIMFEKLPKPDVLLYLDSKIDTIKRNIKKRNRTYERKISHEYLKQIEIGYKKMLTKLIGIPVLIIQIDDLDFVNDTNAFRRINLLLDKKHSPGVHKIDLQGL